MESHTEAEAKTKWCPFARVAISSADGLHPIAAPAHNRAQGTDGSKITGWGIPTASCCLASECMLWTWDEREQAATSLVGASQREKIDAARGRAAGNPPKPERGYCGAAR